MIEIRGEINKISSRWRYTLKIEIKQASLHYLLLLKHVFLFKERTYGPRCVDCIDVGLQHLQRGEMGVQLRIWLVHD